MVFPEYMVSPFAFDSDASILSAEGKLSSTKASLLLLDTFSMDARLVLDTTKHIRMKIEFLKKVYIGRYDTLVRSVKI